MLLAFIIYLVPIIRGFVIILVCACCGRKYTDSDTVKCAACGSVRMDILSGMGVEVVEVE